MLFFVIFGKSAPDLCSDPNCCPVYRPWENGEIVSDWYGVMKSSYMSNIDLVSCTDFNCKTWTAPIETNKQQWIQFEYMKYKAKVTMYFLGDWAPCPSIGWALSGSNDNKTFYTIDAQNSGLESQKITSFNVSSNQYYYRYIRLTFTETSGCSQVSLGLFNMKGDLKKWKNVLCTPFVRKGICMKHALTYVIVCLS